MTTHAALLRSLLASFADPDVNVDAFCATVRRRPALVAPLVRVADSPLCDLPGRIHGLERAVLFLGVRAVAAWAAALLVREALVGSSPQCDAAQRHWQRVLRTALGAQLIARRLGLPTQWESFVAALGPPAGPTSGHADTSPGLLSAAACYLGDAGSSHRARRALEELGLAPLEVCELLEELDKRVSCAGALLA